MREDSITTGKGEHDLLMERIEKEYVFRKLELERLSVFWNEDLQWIESRNYEYKYSCTFDRQELSIEMYQILGVPEVEVCFEGCVNFPEDTLEYTAFKNLFDKIKRNDKNT